MNFQSKIEKGLFFKTKGSKFKIFHEIIFILGKELGWSPSEICESPIPLVMGVLEELKAQHKRQEKASKKKR